MQVELSAPMFLQKKDSNEGGCRVARQHFIFVLAPAPGVRHIHSCWKLVGSKSGRRFSTFRIPGQDLPDRMGLRAG